METLFARGNWEICTTITMANNTPSSSNENNLQSIVNNVVNHPQFRLLLNNAFETSRSATEESQRSQTTSSDTNLQCTSAASTPTPNAGRSTYSNPVEEFNSIFRFGVTRERGAGTVSSFTPISTFRGRAQSRHSRRSRRYSPTATATTTSSTSNAASFTREVVLLSKPTDSTTVKGNAKADLMKKGQVISVFDFKRSWTEEEVLSHIRQAFQEKLEGCR